MLDREILVAALEGLLAQQQRLEEQIQKVKQLIEKAPAEPQKTRRLSDDARERIVEAQKRRWETFRKQKAKGGK